jgi:protein O-mannosyl-transferase
VTSADFKIYRLPRVAAGIIFLCVVVAVCYAGSIGNGFVSDDHYILELNHDGFGVRPIIKMFLENDTLFNSLSAVPYYRPVNRASYAFDKLLFGLNPAGYHIINVVLHTVCTVLFFLTLLRMGCGMFASVTAATLFGIHPINSEAVNFLSARNNILATAFVLASFLAWLRAEETGRKVLFSISAFLFFLAILSKETGIMLLPFLLFLKLYDDRQYRIPNTILTKDLSFIAYHVIFLVVYLLLRSIAIDASFIHDHIAGLTARMHQLFFILPTYFFLFIAPGDSAFITVFLSLSARICSPFWLDGQRLPRRCLF